MLLRKDLFKLLGKLFCYMGCMLRVICLMLRRRSVRVSLFLLEICPTRKSAGLMRRKRVVVVMKRKLWGEG